jgi:hypothetical protein
MTQPSSPRSPDIARACSAKGCNKVFVTKRVSRTTCSAACYRRNYYWQHAEAERARILKYYHDNKQRIKERFALKK